MYLDSKILSNLRKEYGDAFYLLDSEQFRNNFLELKQAFSSIYPNFNIAYSYKTNYTPAFCKIVNELDGYAEVVSEMEMELALKVGVNPDHIIWNGPIKNVAKVEELLVAGGTVNIDNRAEADAIKAIAAKHPDKVLNVGIRVNFDVEDGVISRFGFDVASDDFAYTYNLVQDTKNLYLINLQCHFAKRQIEYWPNRAKGMVALLDRLGSVPERIDLGGGLFGKMADSLKAQFSSVIPNYDDYAKAVATIIANRFANEDKKPLLLIEPGSAVVGDCMKFAGTVENIKEVRGKYIASVMGSQKNISMTGVNPPMDVYHMCEETREYKDMDLVGFTCIENDVLYKNYNGDLVVGDMVVLGNCGSYSIVMKPPFILPNFPILDICDGTVKVIKRKETFEDIFHTYNF